MACHIFTSYELSYVSALVNYNFCRGPGKLQKEQGRTRQCSTTDNCAQYETFNRHFCARSRNCSRLISHELTSSTLRQRYHRQAMLRVCRVCHSRIRVNLLDHSTCQVFRMHAFLIGHLSLRQQVHAEKRTHHAVKPEDADVRERSMRFSGEPGQRIRRILLQVMPLWSCVRAMSTRTWTDVSKTACANRRSPCRAQTIRSTTVHKQEGDSEAQHQTSF